MRFKNYYINRVEVDEINNVELFEDIDRDLVLKEDISFMNAFYKLTGRQKRRVYPNKYQSFVIGSKGYGNLLNKFANEVLQTKDGKKPAKRKIYITNIFEGVPPKVNKLKTIKTKTPSGEVINFWEPVEKVNGVSLYTTNISVAKFVLGVGANVAGDIVLWDVMTQDSFEGIENAEQLQEIGWEEGKNQFVLSVNERGKKLWMQITGMTLDAWVKASKIGSVTDPYGFALKDDIALAKKQAVRKTLTNDFISKDLFNKLVPAGMTESINESEEIDERKVFFNDKAGTWQTYKGKSKDGKYLPSGAPKEISSDDVAVDVDGNPDPELQKKLDAEFEDETPASTEPPKNQEPEKTAEPEKTVEPEKEPEKTSEPEKTAEPEKEPEKTSEPEEQKPEEKPEEQKPQSDNLLTKHVSDKMSTEPQEIRTDANDVAEKGWLYTFNNGGKFYVYKIKNPPSDNQKYKIAYDDKAKEVLKTVPEIGKIVTAVRAKDVNLR